LLIQKHPLPETLISQNPKVFAELFMGGRYAGLSAFAPENLSQYISILEQPEAVHSMCEDYRASSTIDMEEARQDIAAGKLIQSPLLVVWGKNGIIEKCFDAVREWKLVSDSTVEGSSVDCGHYIPEEAPDFISVHIKRFFV
jgi:haloacetate dehalogenase